jgi:DNA-binding HxlR family transcriptional regulator
VARRSYNQYCTLAEALDVLGERWTLLLVRELMLGPRRFKDLLHGLPGIGKNLLAARLKHLEAEGLVVRRQLPPPAGSQVYNLTEAGYDLGPVLTELARWGLGRLGEPRPNQVFRPAWGMFPLTYTADAEAAAGLRETYEFRIDGDIFHIRVNDGEVRPRTGPADGPDLVVTMDAATLLELFSGQLSAVDGLSQGRIAIEGEPAVLGNAMAILAGEPS